MIHLKLTPHNNGLRELWALEEAEADYRVEFYESPTARNQSWRMSDATVPILQDGAAALTESAAICAYVAERFPQAGLAPAVGDPLRVRYFHWLFAGVALNQPSQALALEAQLNKNHWILGDRFSAADIAVGVLLHWALKETCATHWRSAFVRYVEQCRLRPAFQRAACIAEGRLDEDFWQARAPVAACAA